MKRIVSLIVVVSLLVNCTIFRKRYHEYGVKGPILISERVGEVIDAQEREYFGLFPKIYVDPVNYPFESATYFGLVGGGYEVRITTEQGTIVSVNRGENAVVILRDYIDNYEDIVNSRSEFEERWQIVAYDDLGQAITKDEISRVRKPIYTALLAVPGSIVLGYASLSLVAASALASAFGGDSDEAAREAMPIFGAGALLTVAGVFGGRSLDNSAARNAVKESRKPRLME